MGSRDARGAGMMKGSEGIQMDIALVTGGPAGRGVTAAQELAARKHALVPLARAIARLLS